MSRRLSRTGVGAVIGVLALAVAAGGTAVAVPRAHHISGALIKKHSIAGDRLKNNTLTGTQINESTLGVVPHAGVATTAGNAQRLGGVAPRGYLQTGRFFHFSVVMSKGDANRTIGPYGPLTFHASCGSDVGATTAALTVTTSVNGVLVGITGTQQELSTSDEFPIVSDDTATTDVVDDAYPVATTPGNTFTIDGGDAVVLVLNSSAGDCLFAGHLMNVAG
jgi:hypothetical protein